VSLTRPVWVEFTRRGRQMRVEEHRGFESGCLTPGAKQECMRDLYGNEMCWVYLTDPRVDDEAESVECFGL
jgi:hypothetical protein